MKSFYDYNRVLKYRTENSGIRKKGMGKHRENAVSF